MSIRKGLIHRDAIEYIMLRQPLLSPCVCLGLLSSVMTIQEPNKQQPHQAFKIASTRITLNSEDHMPGRIHTVLPVTLTVDEQTSMCISHDILKTPLLMAVIIAPAG
eukprot:scaffold269124_cov17-Prasinocladus_malaysianus.AAC.1